MSKMLISIADNLHIGTGVQLQLSNDKNGYISAGYTVGSSDSWGASSSGDDQTLDVQGSLVGADAGADLGAISGTSHGQILTVGDHGYVAGYNTAQAAVTMRGFSNEVHNAGVIHGEGHGIRMMGVGTTNNSSLIDNAGRIEGSTGISRDSAANNLQQIILHNTGVIEGITNGFILGHVSYNGGSQVAVDTIENAGLMKGSLFLGGGDDSYDGTGGQVNGLVFGDNGKDTLTGGSSSDTLWGGNGDDHVSGAGGDDGLDGDAGADFVDGGAGNDSINGGSEADSLFGGDGDDTVNGDAGADTMHGGAGNDTMNGGSDADIMDGDSGDDALTGGSEADTLRGGDGNDQLDGGTGADSMDGGAGNDTFIVDDAGDKVFDFGGGVDTVRSSVAFNFADAAHAQGTLENLELTGVGNISGFGNAFANAITGNAGNNRIDGRAGNDVLNGGAGNDRLDGGLGNDKLLGGSGNDRLDGGLGKDTMTGGLGNDKFVFDTKLNAATNVDVVTDFKHGTDKMLLDNAIFNALGFQENVTLKAGFFHAGSAAADADDHIIYNKATGALSYDADGVGGQAAVQFATLSSHPTIDFHDFVVI